jgi:hemoglobin-like flavoprotein
MLTEGQIELLRSSFAALSEDADAVAADFYARLFTRDPRLLYLFPQDLTEQRRLLVFMIGYIVRRAHLWNEIAPRIRNLGIRHTSYGVTAPDYDSFGASMLDTLAGRGCGSEELEAWVALFAAVSEAMLEGRDFAVAAE